MPKVMVTTTISQEIWDLARDKAIKWSEALEFGIKEMALDSDFAYMTLDKGQTITKETPLNRIKKLETVNKQMQEWIEQLNDDLEKERARKEG